MMRVVKICCCLLAVIGTLVFEGLHAYSPSSPSVIAKQHASSSVTTTPTTVAKAQINPVRLEIPAIGVNAIVEQVGVLSSGDLETPSAHPWVDVGWFASGPVPGEQGSAVIDGHLDRPGGYPAVFWYLRNVHIGDTVLVVNAQGVTKHFRVTNIAFYQPQAAPLQEIFGNDSGTYLNLITCAGDWIPSQHQTTLRQVVYTVLS
ncbi:MAG TPA: class F sortase [Ktedonobacteraceae bacterium]|nr:class F sortase [Ktedonobacteraceae bacterium]